MSLLLLGLLAGLAATLRTGDALGSDSVVHTSIDLDGRHSTEAARSALRGFETAAGGTSQSACSASLDMLGVPIDVQRTIYSRDGPGGPHKTCSALTAAAAAATARASR